MCSKDGSLNDAKCDPYTDESADLIAGRCRCKTLVEGERCDRCKNGFFNLSLENPEGCECNYKKNIYKKDKNIETKFKRMKF